MMLAGIDLAWQSRKNPTALAVARFDGGHLELTDLVHDLYSVDSILDCLASKGWPKGIAIDAPLVMNNISGQRTCERRIGSVYGARKAACHTSNLTRYPQPDSVALSRALEDEGYKHLGKIGGRWQIECYPHPALIEIFGLAERHGYKKGRASARRSGQAALAGMLISLQDSSVLSLGFPQSLKAVFDPDTIDALKGRDLKRNEDMLDAVICVYIAGLYALGVTSQVFGEAAEGYIYVPQMPCVMTPA